MSMRLHDMDAPASWDEEVDLLVAGGGAGGMTAALVAAVQGCRVLVCEKSACVGGTTARSSGGIWVPGNHQTARRGRPDSMADALGYLQAQLGGADPLGLRAAYLQAGPEAVDFLEQHSEVRFVPFEQHPDYQDLPGAAMGGRPLATAEFDGRLLGRDFFRVAPPLAVLAPLGGMMVSRADIPHLLSPWRSWTSFKTASRLVLRQLRDRLTHARGTRLLMGNALAARLYMSLKQRGVPVWFDAPVTCLVREGRRVIGAEVRVATHEGWRVRRVKARHGVVLATGGFSHGGAWRSALMNAAEQQALSLAVETSTGDGLSLAQGSGAQVARGSLSNACVWVPVSRLRRPGRADLVYPHFFLDRPKPGFIAVNAEGRRFVNEAASYHDFVAGMLAHEATAGRLPAYLVCDHAALARYGMGMVLPGPRRVKAWQRAGYLVSEPTLERLAARLGMPAEALGQTVAGHNHAADIGMDEDFGKGSTPFNRFHGDAGVQPNPCLGRIEHGPFHAVEIWPADLSTFAGVVADAHAQALDEAGCAIPGLHVCGNDMRSPWNGEAPGPGVTLGPAIVFGYVAALHAVGRTREDSEAGDRASSAIKEETA